jgi:hypothetical protein
LLTDFVGDDALSPIALRYLRLRPPTIVAAATATELTYFIIA